MKTNGWNKGVKYVKILSISAIAVILLAQIATATPNFSDAQNDDVLIVYAINSTHLNISFFFTMEDATAGEFEITKSIILNSKDGEIATGIGEIFNGTVQEYSLNFQTETKTIIGNFFVTKIPDVINISKIPGRYTDALPLYFDYMKIEIPQDYNFQSANPGPNSYTVASFHHTFLSLSWSGGPNYFSLLIGRIFK